MFHMPGFDAFVVMLHDQGHIATKLMAQNAAAALTIGTPILFASVAHGTGHDIAGKGIADPAAMIEAVLMMAKAKRAAPAALSRRLCPLHVMPGLVPGIHAFLVAKQDVDGRVKPGHDKLQYLARRLPPAAVLHRRVVAGAFAT